MNPDTTVFIPVPVSEKPEKDGSYWVLKSDDHPLDQFRSTETFECGSWNFSGEKVVAWLKPTTISEIATSQPVREWQLCPKCKGDVCWQDTIEDGQNISITACTMCKGEGKILPPPQPGKSNEDIKVKSETKGIFPDLGKVSNWLEENGQSEYCDIVRNAMTELANLNSYKFDISKCHEDILVKALEEIRDYKSINAGVSFANTKGIAAEALSSYRISVKGE